MTRKPAPAPYTALCPGQADKDKPRKARRAKAKTRRVSAPTLRALVLRFLDTWDSLENVFVRVDVAEDIDALREAVK